MITTNSLGKRIAKTDEQIRAFWRWFGDSKVVDEKGRPLVVYHGTPKAFDTFRPSKVGMVGAGIYLTPHQKDASEYCIRSDTHSEGSRVVPVYLRMEKPRNVKNASEGVDVFWKEVGDYKGRDADEEMTRRNIAAGYDGVIVGDGKGGVREMLVFRPAQIKSAIGNRGTFDPNDPVITNPRRNPLLGNTGLEFQQNAARKLLVLAIRHAGQNPDAADDLIAEAFRFAKQHWQQHHNRILPHREWAQLRLEATLQLAKLVASGQLRGSR